MRRGVEPVPLLINTGNALSWFSLVSFVVVEVLPYLGEGGIMDFEPQAQQKGHWNPWSDGPVQRKHAEGTVGTARHACRTEGSLSLKRSTSMSASYLNATLSLDLGLTKLMHET